MLELGYRCAAWLKEEVIFASELTCQRAGLACVNLLCYICGGIQVVTRGNHLCCYLRR